MIRGQVQNIPYTPATGTDQLIVNITISEQSLYYGHVYYGTANKTAAEIFNAYIAGKDIYALVNGQYIPYNGGNAGHVRFNISQETNGILSEITLIGYEDTYGDIWTFEAVRSAIDSDPGVTDYTDLTNKPSIEGVTLVGNKTYDDLNLSAITNSEIENLLT